MGTRENLVEWHHEGWWSSSGSRPAIVLEEQMEDGTRLQPKGDDSGNTAGMARNEDGEMWK